MDIIPSNVATGPVSRILNSAIDGLSGAPAFLRKQAELRNFSWPSYEQICLVLPADVFAHADTCHGQAGRVAANIY